MAIIINKSVEQDNRVKEIKAELAKALGTSTLYVTVSTKRPTLAMLAEVDGSTVDARPTISQKDGRILFNFGAKAPCGELQGRLQGNYFTNDRVDEETLLEFQEAKQEQATQQAAAKK